MSPHTDTELIQLLKLGDKSAANLLIDRYFDRVVAAALDLPRTERNASALIC